MSPEKVEKVEKLVQISSCRQRHASLSWADGLQSASAERLLEAAFEQFGEGLAIVTSFQAGGSVVLDLASRMSLPLRVITIDTGRLPEETYLQIDRVRDRYGFEVDLALPDAGEVSALVRAGGPNLFLRSEEDRLACCHVRKVLPFRNAVVGLDAWITGLRRDQSLARRSIRKVEPDWSNREDGSLLKLSPLADWTEERVWSYIDEYRVPYHPLYDRGYRSIGCAPCTRPSRPGEQSRAERWWWEQGAKECGLHQRAS